MVFTALIVHEAKIITQIVPKRLHLNWRSNMLFVHGKAVEVLRKFRL